MYVLYFVQYMSSYSYISYNHLNLEECFILFDFVVVKVRQPLNSLSQDTASEGVPGDVFRRGSIDSSCKLTSENQTRAVSAHNPYLHAALILELPYTPKQTTRSTALLLQPCWTLGH